jgi:tubulin-specific chaperone A
MDAKQLKQRTRQIKIKTGACRRLTKDLQFYVKEKNEYVKKLGELKEGGADKHALKKQTELLEETCAVLINTHGKVKEAYTALDQILLGAKGTPSLEESEEFKAGAAQLQATHNLLNRKKKTPAGGPLTLYYWPIQGRAAAVFRMLEEKGAEYKVITDFDEIKKRVACFGAKTANFAVPLIVDGDNVITQSVACNMYIGEKLGFDDEVKVKAKLMQTHLNLSDFSGELAKAAAAGDSLHKFITGGRFAQWMGCISAGINPDSALNSTDFALQAAYQWVKFTVLSATLNHSYPGFEPRRRS